MKKNLTILLQIVIVLIGIAALVGMLWEPTIEGRNANATLYEVYFQDSFLAYAYTASIFFFVALYQAFKALGYLRRTKASSPEILKALRIIQYCMGVLVLAVVGAETYLFIVRPEDDIAGGVAMGLFLIVIFALIGVAAVRFQRRSLKFL